MSRNSIWSEERSEIATWLSGYLSMIKKWVDKILDNEDHDVNKNKIINLLDEWIQWLEDTKKKIMMMQDVTPEDKKPEDKLMEKRLYLILKKDPFDRILDGIKTIEYRDKTDYWKVRLENKEWDHVHFRNGYRKDARTMLIEYKGMDITDRYEIKLGSILYTTIGNVIE